ncbi:MAG: helix-turn-helix transcriptional regulator [Ruminococcaceae bacterium]|nr:helix-turn-helix transcriptional regulator [Oscillospiraceae bacterium]
MRQRKEINKRIGANIQFLREDNGYTQDRLSELIGITPNHLSAIERGVSGISLENLQKLSELLGVSIDSIFYGDNRDNNEELTIAKRITNLDSEDRKYVKKVLSTLIEYITYKNK